MTETTKPSDKDTILNLATFYVSGALCGIDLLKVQEINKPAKFTGVPQAPEYVLGVLNLRGRIVTVIDIGQKLGLSPVASGNDNRNIIINSQNEHVGLFVDRLSDVVPVDRNEIEPAPANLSGVQGKFFEGVYKAESGLVGILDAERVLE